MCVTFGVRSHALSDCGDSVEHSEFTCSSTIGDTEHRYCTVTISFPTLPKIPYQTFTPLQLPPVLANWSIEDRPWWTTTRLFMGSTINCISQCPEPWLSDKHMWSRNGRWSAFVRLCPAEGLWLPLCVGNRGKCLMWQLLASWIFTNHSLLITLMSVWCS